MDFNPDEAIAAGWLRPGSLAARLLERMSRFSLRHAKKIIALDRFMRDRIAAKGISPANSPSFPPGRMTTRSTSIPRGVNVSAAHGLEEKFVVMYSGNHSPVHPLDTLLHAADQMRGDPDIVFCFVGGGSEWRKIKETTRPRDHESTRPMTAGPREQTPISSTLNSQDHQPVRPTLNLSDGLLGSVAIASKRSGDGQPSTLPPAPLAPSRSRRSEGETDNPQAPSVSSQWSIVSGPVDSFPNILCLPYQPLDQLAGSLSAADLHVVVMGDKFVGLVHPCKIYNILSVGAPVLYIGPNPSHVSEIIGQIHGDHLSYSSAHGDVDSLLHAIADVRRQSASLPRQVPPPVRANFSRESLLPRLIAELESV